MSLRNENGTELAAPVPMDATVVAYEGEAATVWPVVDEAASEDLLARRRPAHLRTNASRLERVRARLSGADLRRVFRYGTTSVLALGISEAVLLYLSSATGLSAAASALVANVAGTVPSYLLSRYWIWPEADRQRALRQVVLYWAISLVSMAISSVAIGIVSIHVPRAHLLHLVLLGIAYLVISFVLWVAKYVSYRSLIFTEV